MTELADIIDLATYPLDQPQSDAYRNLINDCKADLDRDGMFNLTGFMKPAAIDIVLDEAIPKLRSQAFTHQREHNIYFKKHIPDLPDNHPALKIQKTTNHTLCSDQVIGCPLDHAYTYAPFISFLAKVMGLPALYPMDDMLARYNVMGYNHGEALNWHFDRSQFTTTLLLQAPEKGGEFEYRTALRSDDDPNYDGVARLLAGKDQELKSLKLAAGTLNVFKGRNTAHRVSPVQDDRQRIIVVFTYYDTPAKRFTKEEQLGFYGRVT